MENLEQYTKRQQVTKTFELELAPVVGGSRYEITKVSSTARMFARKFKYTYSHRNDIYNAKTDYAAEWINFAQR